LAGFVKQPYSGWPSSIVRTKDLAEFGHVVTYKKSSIRRKRIPYGCLVCGDGDEELDDEEDGDFGD
jgi:hypothetical protein